MAYLLDTNIVIDSIRRPSPELRARFIEHQQDLVTSSIVVSGLHYGALNSSGPERNLEVTYAWLDRVQVFSFDAAAAEAAARIRLQLKQAGRPIGAYDTQIAGHAAALGFTLVTNNIQHFERVSDLRLENWTQG